MSFYSGMFALAGAAAAAGPVIIHLLNRRRYRTIDWAAMDFLREAVKRNRKILQLRDIILLALRTLCLLLFGLAMARPYLSRSDEVNDPDQPVHAVLILDNSLSMGFERIDGTLLDEARGKALEFIERLPAGSRISVLPLCGSRTSLSLDAYRTPEDARDAVQRIELVDRSGSAAQAADLALQACSRVPELAAKRVVLLGDQQLANWPSDVGATQLKQVPDLQIVQLSAPEPENAWIADFKLQDGIADVETPATFLVTVRYEGPAPRPNVPVTLTVDNVEVSSQTVDLEPGQERELRFAHRFDLPMEPGQAGFVPATVSLPADRLKADDSRYLSVPVVAALPVVFIDQYGEQEEPRKNQYGETFPLRRLLAPATSRGDVTRQLVHVRQMTIDGVDRSSLKDARLVVVAGVEQPGPIVPVLREFVQQGGQLLIAAGAEFEPQAWSTGAWLEGGGILPTPLAAEPVGRLPDEARGRLDPFFLVPESLVHDYFYVEDSSRQELEDLYRLPLFFKAVSADAGDKVLEGLLAADKKQIEDDREFLVQAEERRNRLSDKQARGLLDDAEQRELAEDERRLAEVQPAWLLWRLPRSDGELSADDLARRWQPRVLASFTNRLPFLIERHLGQGDVLFAASGLQSTWNNLVRTNAVLMYDRILRAMLGRTLPPRNFSTAGQIGIPISATERRAEFSLVRPGAGLNSPAGDSTDAESMTVDVLGPEQYGVTVRDVLDRGHYRVRGVRSDTVPGEAAERWEINLAVNGSPQESELKSIEASVLQERMGDINYRWVGAGEPIHLEGAKISGGDLWKVLMLCVLLALFVELAVLAWPQAAREWSVRRGAAAQTTAASGAMPVGMAGEGRP